MDESQMKKLKSLIDKDIEAVHSAALLGLKEQTTLRLFGESIDIRFAYKEEKAAEKALADLDKKVYEHLVLAAEKDEVKALVNIFKGSRHIYKAVFNPMMFMKHEIDSTSEFIEHILKSKKLPAELKVMIAKGIFPSVKQWHEVLRKLHNGANGVYAAAKERPTVALAMTKALHTSGASMMRRYQEKNLIKDAYHDEKLAEKIEAKLEHMDVKSKNEAQAEIDKLEAHLARSEEEFTKATSLLFVEWEELDSYMMDLVSKVKVAALKHELPSVDPEQIHELIGYMIQKVLEPFLHSIEKGVNQLDDKVKGLETLAKQAESSR